MSTEKVIALRNLLESFVDQGIAKADKAYLREGLDIEDFLSEDIAYYWCAYVFKESNAAILLEMFRGPKPHTTKIFVSFYRDGPKSGAKISPEIFLEKVPADVRKELLFNIDLWA